MLFHFQAMHQPCSGVRPERNKRALCRFGGPPGALPRHSMLIIEAPPGDRFAERNKRTFLFAKARHGCNIKWLGKRGRYGAEPDRRA